MRPFLRRLCLLSVLVLVPPCAMANTWSGFAAGSPLTVGNSPAGVAVGDFNGDGKLDLAVTDYGSNTVSIFLGNGDGTFTLKSSPATCSGPNAIAVGDFNGDGIPDLAVVCEGGNTVDIFLGNGDGTFTLKSSVATGTSPDAIAVGDFNGDGKLDFVVVNDISRTAQIFLGNGNGTFTLKSSVATGTSPTSVAVGNFTGNGILDLAVTNFGSKTVSIFLGSGTGTFTLNSSVATGTGPNAVVVGDFNGDGILDLAVANYGSNTVSIFLGNGAGGFTLKSSPATGSEPNAIAVGDFNGDGKLDLAVTNDLSNTVSILLGNGDGTFTLNSSPATGSEPYPVAAGDFNGTGWLDLAVVNVGSNTVSIFLGQGQRGTMTELVASPTTAATGDQISLSALVDTGGESPTGTVTFYNGATSLGSVAVSTVTTENLLPYSMVTTKNYLPWTDALSYWNIYGVGVSNPTYTPNAGVAPDGSTTATLVNYPAIPSGDYADVEYSDSNYVHYANQSVTFSVWVQATSGSVPLEIWLADSPWTGNWAALGNCTAGTQWQRCTFSTVVGSTAGPGLAVYIRSQNTTAASVYLWGAQIEDSSTVGPFILTQNWATTGHGGTASLNTSALVTPGTYTLTAAYSGDSNDLSSTSAVVTVTITQAASTTVIAGPGSIPFGQPYPISIVVSPGSGSSATPAGSVSCTDGGTNVGSTTLSGGSATLNLSGLVVGSHSFQCTYAGNASFLGSTSNVLSATVGKDPSSVGLGTSGTPSTFGTPVTFTATMTAGGANGEVITFLDGGSSIGTGVLTSGTATLTISTLAGGNHTITASYPGDVDYNGSTSVGLTQVVNTAASSVILGTSGTPSTFGSAVTFTATLTGGANGEIITFYNGAASIGTGTISSGKATLTISTLAVGSQTITASYPGDGNYTGSTSAGLTQVVNKVAVGLAIGSSLNPSTYLSSITITVTTTPVLGVIPTGTVTLTDGSTTLATLTLGATGSAAYTTSALTAGSHPIAGTYNGNGNYF